MPFKTITILINILFLAQYAMADEVIIAEPQQGYTTSILKEPIYNHAEIAIEAMKINNYLATNYDKLPKDQLAAPREHLYYLIDSYVKILYGDQKKIMPDQHDAILSLLFSWSDRLGVPGGAIIYDALKSPSFDDLPQSILIPEDYSLNLNGDLLSISSKQAGWVVNVPYYFMLGLLQYSILPDGTPVQMTMISTGTAKDNSEFGKSQATIMLIYSPDTNINDFSNRWKQAIQIGTEAEEIDIEFKERKSSHAYDPTSKLHKELTTWQQGNDAYGIFYSGIDGTYQWNRPHFLDFMRSLKIKK